MPEKPFSSLMLQSPGRREEEEEEGVKAGEGARTESRG